MDLRSKGEESVRKKKEEKLELRLGKGEWRVERLQPMLPLWGFWLQPIPSNNQRAKRRAELVFVQNRVYESSKQLHSSKKNNTKWNKTARMV